MDQRIVADVCGVSFRTLYEVSFRHNDSLFLADLVSIWGVKMEKL